MATLKIWIFQRNFAKEKNYVVMLLLSLFVNVIDPFQFLTFRFGYIFEYGGLPPDVVVLDALLLGAW